MNNVVVKANYYILKKQRACPWDSTMQSELYMVEDEFVEKCCLGLYSTLFWPKAHEIEQKHDSP